MTAHSATGWDVWHGMEEVIRTIRSTGARQPIVLMSWNNSTLFAGYDPARLTDQSNIVYEVSPRYENTRTNAARDVQFGFLTEHVPVIANDWDLHLDDPTACLAVPSDPEGASQLVLDNLASFDAHRIHPFP